MIRRGIFRRAGVAAALTCSSMLVGSASAFAADPGADSTGQTIVYHGPRDERTTRELIHRLDVPAAATDLRYWLAVTREWGNTDFVGQFADGPISPSLVLEGPGRLGPPQGGFALSATASDPNLYTGRDRCPDPVSASSTMYYELTVPAGAPTTVVVRRRLALTRAPTRASLYVQRWRLAPATSDDPRADLQGHDPILGPLPALAGLKPARLTLYAGITGSGRAVTAGQRLTAVTGRELTLSGQLVPARRGERVTLWEYVPREAKPRRLAAVRVDRLGRFLYRRWRPARAGLHEVFATYAGRGELVEPTRSPCGGPKVVVGSLARRR